MVCSQNIQQYSIYSPIYHKYWMHKIFVVQWIIYLHSICFNHKIKPLIKHWLNTQWYTIIHLQSKNKLAKESNLPLCQVGCSPSSNPSLDWAKKKFILHKHPHNHTSVNYSHLPSFSQFSLESLTNSIILSIQLVVHLFSSWKLLKEPTKMWFTRLY